MAHDESRVVMETLAHLGQKERHGNSLVFRTFRTGSVPLCIAGYSRTGHRGNFGKTTDTFLILSKKSFGPVDWFHPESDRVDFFVLLNTDVRPWEWTLLHHLGDGDFIETDLSAECTIV